MSLGKSEVRGCSCHIHWITQWLQTVGKEGHLVNGTYPPGSPLSCSLLSSIDTASECPCANEGAGSWLPGINMLHCRRDA